ncbi:hypothetical protein OC835_001343 [Tilletia horrida]|nr:hypothetical protein OC835_001343 [Tilletia horrida]KAK0567330.1 hypothetical protein OC844_000308 [Tilletia horrida]
MHVELALATLNSAIIFFYSGWTNTAMVCLVLFCICDIDALSLLPSPAGFFFPLFGAEAAIHTDPHGPHSLEISWIRTLRTSILTYPSLLGSQTLFIADPVAAPVAAALPMTPLETRIANMLLGDEGIITSGPGSKHHRRMRKALGPAFTSLSLAPLAPVLRRHALGLVEGIKYRLEMQNQHSSERNTILDVVPWINAVAFDILAEGGLGYESGCVARLRAGAGNIPKDPLAAAFDATNAAFASQAPVTQVLQTFLGYLFPSLATSSLFARNRAIKTNRKRMEQLARQLIEKRAVTATAAAQNEPPTSPLTATHTSSSPSSSTGYTDFVSRLMFHPRTGRSLLATTSEADKKVLVAQINAFLFAGHETTSSALSWLIYALVSDPSFQTRLFHAIQHLDLESAAAHPLVEAGVKEGLRLFPPARVLRRVAAPGAGGDVILPLAQAVPGTGGRKWLVVPRGQNIVIGLAALNRSKEIWGEDADEFKPERWLNVPDSHTDAHLPFDLASFGFGPKTCIGARFALLELKTLTACLVQHFRFSIAPSPGKAAAGAGATIDIVSRQALFFRPVVRGQERRGSQLPVLVAMRGERD